MTPFLYKVAELFYLQYGSEIYKHTFVFPNRRAAMFLRKYLTEIAGKPLFSPTVLTIQELFASLSSYRQIDRIEMLVILYKHFKRISGSEESFDDFIFWGEMLISDFDDVDKHLVDAKQLFVNVHDFRSLDDDLSHLDEKQIEAMRRFWNNFMPVEGSETKQKFQETWKILFDLYSYFKKELHDKNCAYEGMIFRDVAERAIKKELNFTNSESYIFVGFNLLSPSEYKLFNHLQNIGVADFYWDYESPLILDENNRASYKVKENIRLFPSKFQLKQESHQTSNAKLQTEELNTHWEDIEVRSDYKKNKQTKPNIELIGVPSGVGQAKHASHILSDLIKNKNIPDPNEAINTAIILPDENLLLPVIYSIPNEIGKINVTMGYSLSHSSIAGLMEHISLLQQNQRRWNNEPAFYHRYVKSILNHPLISSSAKTEADDLKNHILKFNRIVIPISEITDNPLLKKIFKTVSHWSEVTDYLHEILSHIYNSLTSVRHSKFESDSSFEGENLRKDMKDDLKSGLIEEEDKKYSNQTDLEREFIVQYYKTVTSLGDRLNDVSAMSIETYFRLLRKLTRGISVPFSGEPLSGLQIMGVLETRVVDFDNLIIMSMNEGVFPIKKSLNSFIPFTLRKGFGLPTFEQQDSTYAYHFYRMISRAKNVYMLYDTRTEGLQTGEVSRYFYQIKYLYHNMFNIKERVVAYDVSAPVNTQVAVDKSTEVLSLLNKYRAGGEKWLSASSVNTYIDCPLKFYFTVIEGLSDEDEVQETIEFDVFGTIFHRLMEIIYKRYINQTVTPDVLSSIIKDDAYLTDMLEKAFAKFYFKDEENQRPLVGQYFLIGEILKSYVKQTLETDKKFTPFIYLDSEYRFNRHYEVNENLKVNFKGSIDRIDRVGDSFRIIDYKSGEGETSFKDMPQLFDSSKNKRPYQILQVFIYGHFYLLENPVVKISPAVYYLRSIFKESNPTVSYNKHPIEDLSVYIAEFKEMFDEVIEEIFDPKTPFSQTKNEKNCTWCPFKEVCGR